MMNKRYSELIRFKTFEERYEYLKLAGIIGKETFGYDRYLNQEFYRKDKEWLSVRNKIIIRDNGCDLGIEGREMYSGIIIHHINPITKEDIINRNQKLFDPDNLICVSDRTHKAIHYGNNNLLVKDPIERTKNDTCPWRR